MSMQRDNGGRGSHINGVFTAAAVSFCLGMTVFYIFYYVICHRHRERRHHGHTASQRDLLDTGLDPSDIASLPSFAHRRSSSIDEKIATGDNGGGNKDYNGDGISPRAVAALAVAEIQCAVCLCELADKEMVRLLPNCKHVFHVNCIDMWLYSHSTCPVCRADVRLPTAAKTAETPESHLGSPERLPPV